MKRAKIMLTAIALFAVVGGALAFKAKKFGGITYYISTTSTSNATLPYTSASFTNLPAAPVYYYTTIQGNPAVLTARFTKAV